MGPINGGHQQDSSAILDVAAQIANNSTIAQLTDDEGTEGATPQRSPIPVGLAVITILEHLLRLPPSDLLTSVQSRIASTKPLKTKREQFFRRRMGIAGFRTLQEVAKRAHVDVSSVSRYVQNAAPAKRSLSSGRIKVYNVLGISDESEIPHH